MYYATTGPLDQPILGFDLAVMRQGYMKSLHQAAEEVSTDRAYSFIYGLRTKTVEPIWSFVTKNTSDIVHMDILRGMTQNIGFGEVASKVDQPAMRF